MVCIVFLHMISLYGHFFFKVNISGLISCFRLSILPFFSFFENSGEKKRPTIINHFYTTEISVCVPLQNSYYHYLFPRYLMNFVYIIIKYNLQVHRHFTLLDHRIPQHLEPYRRKTQNVGKPK